MGIINVVEVVFAMYIVIDKRRSLGYFLPRCELSSGALTMHASPFLHAVCVYCHYLTRTLLIPVGTMMNVDMFKLTAE